MAETKKHYPTDLNRLRASLEKKEADLEKLQQEVKNLRIRVQEANRNAIYAVCEMHHMTPELLAQYFEEKLGGNPNSQLPEGTVSAPAVPEQPIKPANPFEEAVDDDDI